MNTAFRATLVKEFKEVRRDGRLLTCVLIVFALVTAAGAAGWQHGRDLERQRLAAAQAERARWLDQGENNPHNAAHYGVYVFRPQSALATLDPGIVDFVGQSVWLEAHRQNESVYRPAQDATAAQRFAPLTAAMALQLFGPLLIILLGFNAVAGEREQGTLRQVLSQGADLRGWILGKSALLLGVALFVLMPAGIASVFAGDDLPLLWSRALPYAAVYFLYLAIFAGLTLAVSARTESARTSLAILLSLWAFSCILAPRAVASIAESLYPLPAANEWRAALRADLKAGHLSEQTIKADLMRRHGVDKVEDLPVNWRGVLIQRNEEASNEVFDRHFGRIFDQIRRQDEIYQWGALISPLLALQTLSMALAGTDFEHHRHFLRAAEDHRRRMQWILNEDLSRHLEKDWGEYQASPELWGRIPEFRYESPPFRDLAGRYRTAAFLLLAWSVACVVWGARVVRRLVPSITDFVWKKEESDVDRPVEA